MASAPVPASFGPDAWARVVFDFLAAALRDPGSSERLAGALLPLYYARVADLFDRHPLGRELVGLDSLAHANLAPGAMSIAEAI